MESQPIVYDPSHSLYFLGGSAAETSLLRRFCQLKDKCVHEGECLSFETSSEWLLCYAGDAQMLQSKLPLLVFRPFALKGIPFFLKHCNALGIPVSVRCGGTGLAGGCVPPAEGAIITTGHLKKIRNYDRNKGTLIIEPGVTVRQLNRHVEADQWHFSLSMETEGVAGIAGCLSSNARGLRQQQCALYDAIEYVILADGQGEILEVPSQLVCGAEGIMGVILEMKVQLKKRTTVRQDFRFAGTWQDLLTQLPSLRTLQSLTDVIKTQDDCYIGLDGEAWRMPSAISFLQKYLPGIGAVKQSTFSMRPKRKAFLMFSSALKPCQLPEACAHALAEAGKLALECTYSADVLAGSLHCILQAQESTFSFSQKIEQFLAAWAEFTDCKEGMLSSCHGIGLQMRPFMTPFWSEETRIVWQKLKHAFDPNDILGRTHFFPPQGKSLEKRCLSL